MENLIRSMAIITDKFASENIGGMWATVITGLVVVFLILTVLILFLYLLGALNKLGGTKPKKPKKDKNAAPVPVTVSPAPKATDDAKPPLPVQEPVYDIDDNEIIAVISAAVAAYSAQQGKTARIMGIKRSEKQPRSRWGSAGIIENTRPF